MSRTMVAALFTSSEELSTIKVLFLTTSLLFIAVFPAALLAAGEKTKTESCEYDLDMASKKVKIICQGSPSMVNVYATRALLEPRDKNNNNNNNNNENFYDQHILNIQKNVNSFLHTGTRNSIDNPRKDTDFGQQLEPPERMMFPESDNLSLELDVDEAEDRGDFMRRYTGAFSDAMLNVSERLRESRHNFSSCRAALRNISTFLGPGEVVLKPDTDNLRRINNSVGDLKEGIISASRNLYKFMSSILMARNYELQKMADTTHTLMDVTMDGLRSASTAHKEATNEVSTLHDLLKRLRKRLSKEITRHEFLQGYHKATKSAGNCPKQISAIGRGTAKDMQWATGAYMVQSGNAKEHRSIFIMADSGSSSELREYYSSSEIDYNLVGKYFALPFNCSGTGHVVYRRHFYCHNTGTNMIVKYNLKRKETVSELALPGAPFANTHDYTSGVQTNIDLAVDELGLWAVYVTDAKPGNMVIAKIDHKKMEIENITWSTTYPKRQARNAFMICGTLYVTNSTSDSTTFIRYMYSTDTHKEQWLKDGVVPLANSPSLGQTDAGVGQRSTNSIMLSYDFRTSSLYSWNNGRVELFPVYFRESA